MTTEIKSPPVESDWLGARLKRKEDQRLVTGNGVYLADISMRGMLHAMFVLSDSAHAKILSINTAEASKLPGVVKIYTGEDIRDKIKPMPQPVVTPNLPAEYPTFWPLAVDKVKYHGEPVALVVARDRYLAEDAAELIEIEYEDFIAEGNSDFAWTIPEDEWQSLALCYTSGTTGNPKGVVYHHRGAYLNAIGCALSWNMTHHPVYLWTLPMFHCCGWTFPWTIAALAGTNICLRNINAKDIYDSISQNDVTHFCGAPIVLNFIANASDSEKQPMKKVVEVMTAGAAPPAAVLKAIESQGFHITHTYGLTETYGPAVFNAPQEDWSSLNEDDYAQKLIRQGVRFQVLEDLEVMDPETMRPVPRDGATIGEIMFKGNVVMKGYLKNPQATAEGLANGYFHSGDLAVMHPDGYVQIKDRSKDIIISGGENISSIEVEEALYKHPEILEAAVVARPDVKWGETPCAFVELAAGAKVSISDLVDWCRDRLASYKVPRNFVFEPIVKTSTGKVQKFELRARAKKLTI